MRPYNPNLTFEETAIYRRIIQKKTGNRILSQSEIDAMRTEANTHMDWKALWTKILFFAFCIALMLVVIYFQSRA